MMNATAAVTLGNPLPIAIVGPINIDLLDSTGALVSTQSVQEPTGTATSATATFNSVAPGTYTVSASRIDNQNGRAVGTPAVSAPFTVPVVTATTPTSVTVTLA